MVILMLTGMSDLILERALSTLLTPVSGSVLNQAPYRRRAVGPLQQ